MTLSFIAERLSDAGVPDPMTDARLLVMHALGISAASLYADPHREYEGEALLSALRRREAREPLQHILGEVGFYGELYTVSSDCLIPRADTELLVEEAIRALPAGGTFWDLGTGSGCIAISVLAHRPDLRAVAVDVSQRALALAGQNAEKNGVSERVTLLCADLLSGEGMPSSDGVCAILSNPPYIRSAVIPTLKSELSYEPREALDGGEDGLLFYRTILDRYSAPLYLFEIGYDQADALRALANERAMRATVSKDLGGNDRLVLITE